MDENSPRVVGRCCGKGGGKGGAMAVVAREGRCVIDMVYFGFVGVNHVDFGTIISVQ